MTINLQAAGALEKYEAERKKRTGVANFVQTVSTRNESLADLGRDPWADYDALANETPALSDGDDVQFVIVGGGHNGIIFAAELIKAGFSPDRLVIVDEAGGFGGTWYWNRYPGLTCDVESYCYLPLLEDTGFVPKHRYSRGEEIRENAERIVQKFGIRAMFCTRLLSADWDESLKRWVLCLRRNLGPAYKDLNRDFVVHTQFFIPACGPLNILSAPNLPGLDKFRRTRTMFHTARWDYDYTGGTQENPEMVNLGDKVVGIIGTGATSVQVTPELAKYAKHVYVFQRTPSYVGPRTQLETTPEVWAKVVAPGPGWQLARQQNLDGFLSDDPALTEDDDLLKDGWSRARSFAGLIGSPRARNQDLSSPDDISAHLKAMVDRELPISEGLRAHVRQVVKDPDTAAKLTAWYPGWCKRPTFHQYYLQCFNQPNVTLVDTDGQGVQAYTEKGVVVGTGKNAKEYELDALVLATGFSQEKGLALGSSGAPIRGRGGLEINEKMEAGGASFLGVAAPGFPNMFFSLSVGATASANTTTTYTTSSRVVTELLRRRAAGDDRAVVEADAEATARYTDLVAQKLGWFAGFTVCPPTYFTRYKDVTPGKTGRDGVWPYGPVDFRKHVDEYIHAGDFTGFNVSA